MIFDENISENDYYNFWKKSDSAHFLNAYWWGKCNAIMRSQKPLYVGLRDKDNNILCEALLLKRRTPFNMCYYYCPRGYVMDWHNEKLLKTFTEELKKYLIKTNGIYLKIDPAIIYEDMDDEGNKIDDGKNNYALFNYLKEIGYQHKGFNKLYEGNQPRYSFRTFFKEYNNFNDIESKISKTFMRSIKRSYNYELKIELANNIDNFYELAQRVSNKDGFKLYKKAYYEEIFNEYGKNGYIKNFIAKINPHELINTFREQLKSEKNIDKINKLNKDIEYFQSLNKDEYVCASLICIYTEKGAWSLYIGNDEVAEYTGTVNRLYYEFIKDAYENKKEFADLFGVVGDPHTKYKNLAGIYEYKRKLGGTYIQLIGEFDLVNKKCWYKILPTILKIYRKIKR